MSWLRAPTSEHSRPRRSSRAPTATLPWNGWRSSRRARAWTAWWRGSRADTRAAAWPSWATSPISADWFARCSPTRAGRSWSSARARLACSSSPARWGGARRAGVPWLLSRLTQRRERAYQDIRERIAPKFDRLARRLRRALGSVPPPDATLPASLASLIAQLLEEQGRDLERRLGLIRSPANHAEAHAARIPAKRAPYLLEPVVREAKPAAAVVRRLKQVQQVLGDLHDLQVVIVRLGDAAAEAAAQRTRRLHELAVGGDRGAAARGPRPATSGLLALSRVARATQEGLFRRLVSRRLARSLPAQLPALAAELRPPAPIVTAAPAARRHLPLPARYTHRARA